MLGQLRELLRRSPRSLLDEVCRGKVGGAADFLGEVVVSLIRGLLQKLAGANPEALLGQFDIGDQTVQELFARGGDELLPILRDMFFELADPRVAEILY